MNKDYLLLLAELTKCPVMDEEEIVKFYEKHYLDNKYLVTIVIEDIKAKKLVGNGKIVIEPKFTRGLSMVAHIEDIVVSSEYNGKGLGKRLLLV